MDIDIPAGQLERIRPVVDSVAASVKRLSEQLAEDAPSAADYSPSVG